MILPPHLNFWCNGCLVPCLAFEDTAGYFLVCAAPLFEEEGNVRGEALVAYVNSPIGFHWSCARAGFTADNDPVNAFESDIWNWLQERFERYKFYRSRGLPQVVYPEDVIGAFDSNTHPNVFWPGKLGA